MSFAGRSKDAGAWRSSRGRTVAVAGLLVGLIAGSAVFALGGELDALVFLPALLLLLAPVLGRYPGEETLLRLGRRGSRRSTDVSQPVLVPRVGDWVPGVLALLAASRRLRGPPVAGPACA